MWVGILALFGKVFDFLNPWSPYWVNKLTQSAKDKRAAQEKIDAAAKKGDFDAFDDARADRDNS